MCIELGSTTIALAQIADDVQHDALPIIVGMGI